jgi:hypothetical protein
LAENNFGEARILAAVFRIVKGHWGVTTRLPPGGVRRAADSVVMRRLRERFLSQLIDLGRQIAPKVVAAELQF